jgi:cell division septal protein FtsQ
VVPPPPPRTSADWAAVKRRQERRRRRGLTFRRRLVLLLMLVAIGLTARVVFRVVRGPKVRIQAISVVGARSLSAQAVIERSGVRLGESLYWINTGQVEWRLQRLPNIAAARVECDFPHRLVIRVTERRPKLFILRGQEVFYLDRARVVFWSALSRTDDLTRLTGLSVSKRDLGKALHGRRAGMAFQLWEGLRRLGLRPSLIALGGRQLSATLADGTQVWFGDDSDLRGKLKRLADCWQVMRRSEQRASYIDLRLPELVTWRPRGSEGQDDGSKDSSP